LIACTEKYMFIFNESDISVVKRQVSSISSIFAD